MKKIKSKKCSTIVGDAKCIQNVVGKPEDKRPNAKRTCTGACVDNIKMDLAKTM
jgi:hypothetical protein